MDKSGLTATMEWVRMSINSKLYLSSPWVLHNLYSVQHPLFFFVLNPRPAGQIQPSIYFFMWPSRAYICNTLLCCVMEDQCHMSQNAFSYLHTKAAMSVYARQCLSGFSYHNARISFFIQIFF